MRLYKTHKTQGDLHRVITINEEYSERYCSYKLAGPESVIDYVIVLRANNEEDVNIYCDIDQQTLAVIISISEGIDEVIRQLKLSDITLRGIDILIKRGVYHPTDFKARLYSSFTAKRLKEILFRSCLKYSRKPFKSRIEDHLLSSETLDRTKINVANLYNDYDIVKAVNLPNIHEKTLYLPKDVLVQKEFKIAEREENVIVSIVANDFGYRHLNRLRLSTPYDKGCVKAFTLLLDGLEQLKKDCYEQGYNLGGMNVYINRSSIDNINENSLDFTTQIYWFLKDYLLRCNEIERI